MGDEFTRIARIKALLAQPSADVQLGIGDDAAVLAPSAAPLVVSVDTSVEGVHFERAWLSLRELAARAFSAAISDLAAMGATPRAALCALALPKALSDQELDELVHGLAQSAHGYACPIVGGNLSRAGELSITTTVLGAAGTRVLTRNGARAGDQVFVTGTLGGAALGLSLLQAGRRELAPSCVQRFVAPVARIAEGLVIAAHASAAIDVSDGALQDLAHLCTASEVGATLHAAALPLPDELTSVAKQRGLDALTLALTGGEDYELLYTLPQGLHGPGTCIGVVTARVGVIDVLDAQGQTLPIASSGYRHFGA